MAKTSNYLFKLDLMILSLLKEKDQYAYELTKEIAEKSKGRIEPKNDRYGRTFIIGNI